MAKRLIDADAVEVVRCKNCKHWEKQKEAHKAAAGWGGCNV